MNNGELVSYLPALSKRTISRIYSAHSCIYRHMEIFDIPKITHTMAVCFPFAIRTRKLKVSGLCRRCDFVAQPRITKLSQFFAMSFTNIKQNIARIFLEQNLLFFFRFVLCMFELTHVTHFLDNCNYSIRSSICRI